MAGTIVVDTIRSDSSYASQVNVTSNVAFTSPVNFTGGMQVGGQEATFGNRNIVINGDMRIAQRNTSATGVGVDGSSFPTVDRAKFFSIGSATARWTCTQSTDAPSGFGNSIKFECTTAAASPNTDARHQIGYVFEGSNLQQLKYGTADAKPLTVSFWIKASRTGTQAVFLYQYTAFSGTGGFISRYVTINAANTWEYKTITIAGNTATALVNDNTAQLNINFPMYLGSLYTGGTFQDNTWRIWETGSYSGLAPSQVNHASAVGNIFAITGIQIEVGSSATAFEYRQYEQELSMCQRYYERGLAGFVGTITSGHAGGTAVPFAVTKRASPTMSQAASLNASGFASGVGAYFVTGVDGVAIYHTATVTGNCSWVDRYIADAEL